MAVEQIDRIVIAASGFQSVGEVLPDLDHGDMVWYPVFLDVYADQTKDLDRLCKTIVANFDTESLEPTRQAPVSIEDLVKRWTMVKMVVAVAVVSVVTVWK